MAPRSRTLARKQTPNHVIQRQLVVISLKDDTKTKLNLSGRAQLVDACSDPDAIHVVAGGSRSIDLPCCSRQKPIESSTRQVKLGKVEKVIETRARLECNPLSDLVRPSDFQIQSTQPGEIDFPGWWREWHRWSYRAKLLQLLQRKQSIINEHPSRRRRLVGIDTVVFGDDIVDIRGVDPAIEVPDVCSGYLVLGRSVKSVRKISPGPRFVFGTTSDAQSGL